MSRTRTLWKYDVNAWGGPCMQGAYQRDMTHHRLVT